MKTPVFDENGRDRTTFAPFLLENALSTEWRDVRLVFDDWDWVQEKYGADTIDGYYLNGYGVEGLVKATLLANGLDPDDSAIDYDSEGDTCNIHFKSTEQATRAAEMSAAMFSDRDELVRMIGVARGEGFED